MSSLLEEMIERVIRYSTLSATATTQDKTKTVNQEYLALPAYCYLRSCTRKQKHQLVHDALYSRAPSEEFAFFA